MATAEADILAGRFGTRADDTGGVTVTTSDPARAGGEAQPPAVVGGPLATVMAQPMVRKLAPYAVAGLVLLLAIVAIASLTATPPRALYPDMVDSEKEAAQEVLRKAGIKVQIDAATGNLTVGAKDFHEARIALAAAGLPHQASTGVSGLKSAAPLGTSQFMEQMQYNASIEEELAQSIKRINTVQDARVHLALPRQSAFVREQVVPKASVIVTPYTGRALSDGQVQAIVHLVSSSIPYMTPESVSVVDQYGRLLTESADGRNAGSKQVALQQKLEADYSDKIIQLLAPLYGAANVRAQVAVEMDFSVVEQATEAYDPEKKGNALRSEQLRQSQSRNQTASGVPGSLSNAPPEATTPTAGANLNQGAAPAAEAAIRDSESSTARSFEIDRSVRYVKDQTPHLTRLSAAVTLNDSVPSGDPATPPTRKPLTPEELARLTDLVKGAIGFNASRGDQVNLISASFELPVAVAALPLWQQQKYLDLARYLAIALSILLAALFIIRPVVARLTAVPAGPSPEEIRGYLVEQGINLPAAAEPAPAEDAAEAEDPQAIQEGETLEQFRARMKPKKSGISAEMLDTANSYDDKVTVVRMLVSQDARRVALVLKNLIAREIN